MTGKKRFISLRVKMTLGVILICFVIGMLAIFSVSRIASNMIDKEYGDKAEEIAEAVVNTLDPEEVTELTDAVMDIYKGVDEVVTSTEWGTEEWEAYMSNYDGIKELPVFKKIQEHFRVYQDIF